MRLVTAAELVVAADHDPDPVPPRGGHYLGHGFFDTLPVRLGIGFEFGAEVPGNAGLREVNQVSPIGLGFFDLPQNGLQIALGFFVDVKLACRQGQFSHGLRSPLQRSS